MPGDYRPRRSAQQGGPPNFVHPMAGWMRPFPEASQYHTEIEGLYLCGPYTHPSGGVFAACGYNAFKSIAHDHDLPKLWEQTDRGY